MPPPRRCANAQRRRRHSAAYFQKASSEVSSGLGIRRRTGRGPRPSPCHCFMFAAGERWWLLLRKAAAESCDESSVAALRRAPAGQGWRAPAVTASRAGQAPPEPIKLFSSRSSPSRVGRAAPQRRARSAPPPRRVDGLRLAGMASPAACMALSAVENVEPEGGISKFHAYNISRSNGRHAKPTRFRTPQPTVNILAREAAEVLAVCTRAPDCEEVFWREGAVWPARFRPPQPRRAARPQGGSRRPQGGLRRPQGAALPVGADPHAGSAHIFAGRGRGYVRVGPFRPSRPCGRPGARPGHFRGRRSGAAPGLAGLLLLLLRRRRRRWRWWRKVRARNKEEPRHLKDRSPSVAHNQWELEERQGGPLFDLSGRT